MVRYATPPTASTMTSHMDIRLYTSRNLHSALVCIFLVLSVATVECKDFTWLDLRRIGLLMKDATLQPPYKVVRNDSGSTLFLLTTTNSGTLVTALSGKESSTRVVTGGSPALTEDGTLICSIINQVLVFTNGYGIPLTPASRFGFSFSGDFFYLLQDTKSGAAAYQTKYPSSPIVKLPPEFLPQSIFATSNQIFLFGQKPVSDHSAVVCCGLTYHRAGATLRLETDIALSQFGGVLDMDTDKRVLLVESRRDKFGRWGLFNLDNSEYTSLGVKRGYGFFLDGTFRKFLEGHWK
jgi:hypothetical protein